MEGSIGSQQKFDFFCYDDTPNRLGKKYFSVKYIHYKLKMKSEKIPLPAMIKKLY